MPPADNTAALTAAARRRAEQARARAENTLAAAARTGSPTTVAGLARAAGVSRSWLYTQTDLITAIGQLRQRHPSPERTGPQPSTITSLRHRLDTALARIKQLRADNATLTRDLETAHGEIRHLRTHARPRADQGQPT